jgi:plasmid stabilization system protein ParE
MKYQVIVTPEAEANITAAFEYIYQRSPMNATRWIRGLYSRIETFEEFPGRCGIAREAQQGGEDLRQFIYYSHRIIFRIEEENGIVRILHVRHGAQRTIGEMPED